MKTKALIVILILAAAGLAVVVGSFLLRTSSEIEHKTVRQTTPSSPEKDATLRSFLPGQENATNNTFSTQIETPANRTIAATEPVPGRDRVVTPSFLADLADFILDNYHPAGTRLNPTPKGLSTVSFKSLNTRYGIEMIGLRHRSPEMDEARLEIIDHLFMPMVIETLYALYKERFVSILLEKAGSRKKDFILDGNAGYEQRTLSEKHVKEMLVLHAPLLRQTGMALKALGSDPGLSETVKRLLTLEQAAMLANDQYSRARYAFEELRLDNATSVVFTEQEALRKSQENMEEAAQAYRTAIKARAEAKQDVLAGLRPLELGLLSDYDLLFLAKWVSRRMEAQRDVSRPLSSAGAALMDMAEVFENAAEKL